MQKTKRHLLRVVPVVSGLALLTVLVGGTIMLLHSPDDVVETDVADINNNAVDTKEEPKPASVIVTALNGEDWSYNINDSDIVELLDTQLHEEIEDNEKTTKHEFVFKGTKSGSTIVTFESDDGTKVEYNIVVDEELNAEASEREIILEDDAED